MTQILLRQESDWSLAALLGLSAAAASACAAWFALGSVAAWQRQKTLTSSCSSCWLEYHASTTSKLKQKNLDNISLYRGVKLVSSKMVGLDDLPITSSESEFTASSGGEDVYELYEWFNFQGGVLNPVSSLPIQKNARKSTRRCARFTCIDCIQCIDCEDCEDRRDWRDWRECRGCRGCRAADCTDCTDFTDWNHCINWRSEKVWVTYLLTYWQLESKRC